MTDCPNCHAETARADRAEAGCAALIEAVKNEPELPGGMPDEMWAAIKNDPDAAAELYRIVVRKTKENILASLEQPHPGSRFLELAKIVEEWAKKTHTGDHDSEECELCASLRQALAKLRASQHFGSTV